MNKSLGCTDCGSTNVRFSEQRVFCPSLADWLDDEVPIEWLSDLIELISMTNNLTWLLLTKRPENFFPRMKQVLDHIGSAESFFACRENESLNIAYQELHDFVDTWINGGFISDSIPPKHVWIGTSVGNKKSVERVPEVLKIPASIHFLSCEPMLAEFNIEPFLQSELLAIDWVICGGESGRRNPRPMHPDWARSLRNQCVAAGTPFFFKQWGDWKPIDQMADGESDRYYDPKHGTCAYGRKPVESTVLHLDGAERFDFPPGAMTCFNIGKHRSGRLLDGREWNQLPTIVKA